MNERRDVCKRCGYTPVGHIDECPFCKIPTVKYDTGFSKKDYWELEWDEMKEIERRLLEDVIKKSPEFSQEAMEFREMKTLETIKESARKCARSSPTITCPYCNSTNTRKATAGSYVSNGFFGFFSKSFGKQWHCNNCGSDF